MPRIKVWRNAAPKAQVGRDSQPPRFNDGRLPTAPTAAPAHPRFAWARTVYPRCKRNAKSPQPPKVPRSPLSQTATRCNNRPRRPRHSRRIRWESRDWSEAEIGQAKRSPYRTPTARRTHHRPRPPRQAQRTSTAQGTRKHGTRAWRGGVESPRSRRWGNATHHANAAAPRPRATAIQPPSLDFSRTCSWARREEG